VAPSRPSPGAKTRRPYGASITPRPRVAIRGVPRLFWGTMSLKMRSRGRSLPVYGLDRPRRVPAWLFWALASLVAVGAGVGVALLNSDENETPPRRRDRTQAARADKDAKSSPVLASARDGSPAPTTAATPTAESSSTPAAREGRGLQTKGVTVQVLNATTDRKADNRMAHRLRGLGYDVVAIHPASRIYGKTTVFWSHSEDKDASIRLATQFKWPAEHKPRNLSGSVTAHVVVGQDEAN
jgi:hypothetical protein